MFALDRGFRFVELVSLSFGFFGVGISIGSLQGLEVGGESLRLEESRTPVLACLGLFVAPLLRVWLYCLVVDGILGARGRGS